MRFNRFSIALIIISLHLLALDNFAQSIYLRKNQLGSLPNSPNSLILLSKAKQIPEISIHLNDGTRRSIKAPPIESKNWGSLNHYLVPVSAGTPHNQTIWINDELLGPITVAKATDYQNCISHCLQFLRQQRCGYNPYLKTHCHQKDAVVFYHPDGDQIYLDCTGGYHDAGDQLKYLITTSFTAGILLKSFQDFPNAFSDQVDEWGQPSPNQVPDVLDEVQWALDWIAKLHPTPEVLIHQVADDRDHRGWKWPQKDISDYGWGTNSYRAAYVANGKSQGLGKYLSQATGIANLAGRSAAVLALGAEIWRKVLKDTIRSNHYLLKAKSLYRLGKLNPGFQQGNSYGAPYRYNEMTWQDDMEWAGAELFDVTGDSCYLLEAIQYARGIGAEGLMIYDSANHYQHFPFINLGHSALFPFVNQSFQDSLIDYYKLGLEVIQKRSLSSPYGVGHPFIWCSNNVAAAMMTQIIQYEKMSGDQQSFRQLLINTMDWIMGRNPWGSSMITGVPAKGDYPVDIHTSIYYLTREVIPGGLVDGPVYTSIYNQLLGLTLTDPDEYAEFQTETVVYHDDIGDYSTNEPTLDGTATIIYPLAFFRNLCLKATRN